MGRAGRWIIPAAVVLGVLALGFHCFHIYLPRLRARDRAALELMDVLAQAIKAYEFDHGAFPPGDGQGSKGLVACLGGRGPGGLAYYSFSQDMVGPDGIRNPARPGEPAPRGVLHYRGDGRNFDLWCDGSRGRLPGPNPWMMDFNWE